MTQLFAKIKKQSKYFSQNILAKQNGEFPFPVMIGPDKEYCVYGGPGGLYRLKDINLYVIIAGQEKRIK